MDDPMSRLEVATREIDVVFGDCYAAPPSRGGCRGRAERRQPLSRLGRVIGQARVDQTNNVSECIGVDAPVSGTLSIAPNRPCVSPSMPSVK
jgi:hypothetical protein